MTDTDYVSYPLALALKKHGFDEPCRHHYDIEDAPEGCYWEGCSLHKKNHNEDITKFSAPTLWQAQKWLRERKKLHCQVLLNGVRTMYFWQIRELVGNGKHAESKHQYEIYEDAMNNCVAAALELIEKKGE